MCKLLTLSLLLISIFIFRPAWAEMAPTRASPAINTSGNVSYFPVFPYGASSDTSPSFVPVVASTALDADHRGITGAVLYIHDINRDAQHDLGILKTLAGSDNSHTLIIVPQFMIGPDIDRYGDRLPEKGRMFSRWSIDGWIFGDDSTVVSPQKGISSFTVTDLILLLLADKKAFPDLQRVTVAGLGLGANYVQRYAAVGQAPALLNEQGLSLHFLSADPSSFLYLTATRFQGPKQGFGTPDEKICPPFDEYPYGLVTLNAYARRTGANAIKTQYPDVFITYLVSDPMVSVEDTPDKTCQALQEGGDYFARAQIYEFYLHGLYGDKVDRNQAFVGVPKAHHDMTTLFGSRCGMSILFGDGRCRESPTLSELKTAQ